MSYPSGSGIAPPVVIPGGGNNIVVNPLQVCGDHWEESYFFLTHVTAWKYCSGLHSKCREGIWRHRRGLSGRKDNGCSLSQVPDTRAMLRKEILTRQII